MRPRRRVVLLCFLLLACQRAPRAAPRAGKTPGPPAPAAAAPAPAGLQARITAGTLEVSDGAAAARLEVGPEACAMVVDLAEGGQERGVWLARGPRVTRERTWTSSSATFLRLRPDGKLEELSSYTSWMGDWRFGSSKTGASLLDLDGDGIFELVLRTMSHDDTGVRDMPAEVFARGPGGGPFLRKRGLRPPPRSALFLGDGDAIPKAIEKAAGEPVRLLDLTPMELAQSAGTCDPERLDQAFPPTVGSLFAAVSFPRADFGTKALRLTLHVVLAYDRPARVLASAPLGTLSEGFTSDACRVRERVGSPLVSVAPSQLGPAHRLLVAVFATGAARTARAFRWDGAKLAAGDPVELDRCDTPPRVAEVVEKDGAILVVPRAQ